MPILYCAQFPRYKMHIHRSQTWDFVVAAYVSVIFSSKKSLITAPLLYGAQFLSYRDHPNQIQGKFPKFLISLKVLPAFYIQICQVLCKLKYFLELYRNKQSMGHTDDESSKYLWYVGKLLPCCMAQQPSSPYFRHVIILFSTLNCLTNVPIEFGRLFLIQSTYYVSFTLQSVRWVIKEHLIVSYHECSKRRLVTLSWDFVFLGCRYSFHTPGSSSLGCSIGDLTRSRVNGMT